MTFQLTRKTRVGDIQRHFSNMFPYLKIEFFNRPNAWHDDEDGYNYHPGFLISKIAAKPYRKSYIDIYPWDKTGAVEEELLYEYGLFAQIYRRFEDRWIMTGGSDVISLDEQNELGKESAEYYYEGLWVEREKTL